MAAKPQRLSALQRQDPVGRPASRDLVGKAPVVHELLAFPERQFVFRR